MLIYMSYLQVLSKLLTTEQSKNGFLIRYKVDVQNKLNANYEISFGKTTQRVDCLQ